MRTYYLFLKENFHPVSFGWLLTFFSSFGQTFFISLFVPAILEQFSLSKSAFGGYYAVATVIASFFLLQFGHLVDSRPLKPFTSKVILLLLASSIGLGLAVHPLMVFLALIGLRLGGQGMMSHISSSVMSRYFEEDRGKALSISSMGYPMAEMVFPLLIGLLLTYWQWQNALIAASTVLLFLFLMIRQLNLEAYDVPEHKKDQPQKAKWQFFHLLVSERAFWILIPSVFLFSFIATGIFFFQYVLAEERGWPLEWYAMCFSAYAVVRFLFSFYGGILTDRFSAHALFPFYLIPLILGLIALASITGKIAPLLFLLLIGVTAGLSGIIKSAVIAELYGVERIGQVRSLFSMISVLSTALAPIIFGLLLDHEVTLSQIALGSAIVLGLASLNSLRLRYLD